MTVTVDPAQPMLRTLAPMLQGLQERYRAALEVRRLVPWSIVSRSELEGLQQDLLRKSEALRAEQPLLVILLMGGTGVGKSSLMNALAGAAVAQSSFSRPTTRDPVVYFHQSIHTDRLDPALRLCRLVRHDREALRDKIIVDTPDVDSNDLLNREKLFELMPLADIVLFVGSQEKYHDQLVWDVFKSQRQRRAFAFVLNKWDRCQDPGAAGLRPDEDWLRDLHQEGFVRPKLFRTMAQWWVDQATSTTPQAAPMDRPVGEEFPELVSWLEAGLTRLEIDAVKARGVAQLLTQAEQTVRGLLPPDYAGPFKKTTQAWLRVFKEEATTQTEILTAALEPYQQELEQHFSSRGHDRFRGLMAAYLRVTTKLRYLGSALRDKFPVRGPTLPSASHATWDLTSTVQTATQSVADRVLTQRLTALVNRLLVDSEQNGLPMALINEATLKTSRLPWDERTATTVLETLQQMEAEVAQPTGGRKWIRETVGFLGNFVPELVLISSIGLLLYRFFIQGLTPEFFHVLLPVYVTLATLVMLHILILMALPVRWSAIRGEFQSRLNRALSDQLGAAFLPVLKESTDRVAEERRALETILVETQTVASWLKEREEATSLHELYGSSGSNGIG